MAATLPGCRLGGLRRTSPQRRQAVHAGLLAPPALQLREEHGNTLCIKPLWEALYEAG